MINNQMKTLPYFCYKEAVNEYGEDVLELQPQGTIKIAINLLSQNTSENIMYKDASFIGLTFDKSIDDTYVIQVGTMKLKVLYVNPFGKYRQVYLAQI